MLRTEPLACCLAILSLTTASTTLHSYSDDMRLRNFENRLTALEDRRDVCCTFNPPARLFASDCFGIYLEISALYWKGYLGFPSFGVVTDQDPTKSWGSGDKRVLMLDPLSGWGFECTLGCNLAYDSWDMALSWTRWHRDGMVSPSNNADVALAPSGLLDPSVLPYTPPSGSSVVPVPYLSSATYQANAKVNFDWVRLENGRQFYFSPQFIVRPHTGLSFLWLKDIELISTYQGTSTYRDPSGKVDLKADLTASSNHQINFSGIGLRMGSGFIWDIGCNLRLVSSIAYGLHYGEFKLAQQNQRNVPALALKDSTATNAKYKAVQDTVDLSSAIQWSWTWGCGNYGGTTFVFEAGWKGLFAPCMNQTWTWCSSAQNPGYVVQEGSPVFLGGWFLSGRADF